MNFKEQSASSKGSSHRRRSPTVKGLLFSLAVVIAGAALGVMVFWGERLLRVHYDLLIVNGNVIDGTGAPMRSGSIGIRNGRIERVRWLFLAEAHRTIDGRGLVVAPGFIDVHTHIEGNVSGNHDTLITAQNFVSQGVTTIITGNCGRSAASLNRFFDQLERRGAVVNIGSLVGHNAMRQSVMNLASRAPTESELNRMRHLVEEAMRDGALGISTGLEYEPGMWAKEEEIQALAEVAKQYDGIYTTHVRDEGNGVVDSVREAIAVGAKLGMRVEVSHLKVRGRSNWGRALELVAMIERARKDGVKVTCDAYPYTASSTSLDTLIPKAMREDGKLRERLRDPAKRQKIVSGIIGQMRSEGWKDFSFARVAQCSFAPQFDGLTIPEVTELRRGTSSSSSVAEGNREWRRNASVLSRSHGRRPRSGASAKTGSLRFASATVNGQPKSTVGSRSDASSRSQSMGKKSPVVSDRLSSPASLEDQAETICYLESRGGAQMIFEAMSEEDVAAIEGFPYCMLGSDSAIRTGDGHPHPRGYGAAPRLFAQYVRERKMLTLEEAIHRLTALPADTFNLERRGRLEPGYRADIVIFDPGKIRDPATYDDPFQPAEGISYVIVNGVVAFEGGVVNPVRSGQVIKRK